LSRLERVIGIGNYLFGVIRSVDHNWRTAVTSGKTRFDPKDAEDHEGYFREWLVPTARCVKEIESFVVRGFTVQGANEFEQNCMEARRYLLGQTAFFDDAKNAARWNKLTSFLRPQPGSICIDDEGRIFDTNGQQVVRPGLDAARMLKARDEMRGGRRRSLKEIIASRTHNE
jgi:hypothetical protein